MGWNVNKYFSGPERKKAGKVLYTCSANKQHRITKNTAKNSGYMCTMCGAPLKVRAQKMAELEALKRTLRIVE